MNNNCGGTSLPVSLTFIGAPAPVSSSSGSTARSQRVTWSSAEDATKEESSVGCHSIEVMGALCHVNEATGVGLGVVSLD